MDFLFRQIDIYCERTAPGLLAEPLNLFSNLWFVFIGLVLLYRKPQNNTLRNIAWMFVAIGIGSGLFHSFANKLTELCDVIPIGVCVLYFFINLVGNLNLTTVGKYSTLLGFVGLELIVTRLKFPVLNGSEMYLGPLFFLWFFSLVLRSSYKQTSNFLIFSASSFTLSLFFRSIDMKICEQFPYGSHFLWHTFNMLTLFFAYMSLDALYTQKAESK